MNKNRDSKATVASNHVCADLTSSTLIPWKNWRENYLNCRKCKRNLVVFLGDYFLKNSSTFLSQHQKLYVAGAFEGDISDTAWFVTRENNIPPDPVFLSNAEETDTHYMATCMYSKQETLKFLYCPQIQTST